MSLPGVESARRRRVSHGRSALGFVQPPPLHRRSCFHPAGAAPGSLIPPARLPDPSEKELCDALNERALAARLRLDGRLRDSSAFTPPTDRRQSEAASISRPVAMQPRDGRGDHRSAAGVHMRMMKELETVVETGSQQLQADDCAVCLDRFMAGQTVVALPCHHSFHNHCILPWLRNHSHCPSCRAKVP